MVRREDLGDPLAACRVLEVAVTRDLGPVAPGRDRVWRIEWAIAVDD
jgi:hypothetical protein